MKIALVKFHDVYSDYENIEKVAQSITDWQEVEEATVDLLKRWSYKYGYTVVEQLPEKEVFDTIDAILLDIKKTEERAEKEKKRREKEAAERKLKKAEKTREQKLAQLEKLKKELGEG